MKIKIDTEFKINLHRKLLLCLIVVALLLFLNGTVHAQSTTVNAILFYSPSCPHCHQVISEDLPPLIQDFQNELFIIAVNIANPDGQILFKAIIDYHQIPPERQGVPMLLVGDEILVGSYEIPNQFPGLIADGLANGGIKWPDIPELRTFLEEQNIIAPEEFGGSEEISVEGGDTGPNQTAAENLQEEMGMFENMAVADKFAQDYLGNSVSVFVLVGMIFVTGRVGKNFLNRPLSMKRLHPSLAPILIIIGFSVALYMSYVEVTQTEAICGPVGHCNTVQQSPYAYLFGIIPIGVLGVIGYFVIALTWLAGRFGPCRWKKLSIHLLFSLTILGTLFSIYLTFLEPFIIGASCAWCLTSAIVMTLLLIYSQGYVFASEEL